jgi:hypothetical protein
MVYDVFLGMRMILSDVLSVDKKGYWFMDVNDKISTDIILRDGAERFCPPHYIPHKLPFGEKVTNEPCHFHESKLRTAHHDSFCRFLECPNYELMLEARKKYKNEL